MGSPTQLCSFSRGARLTPALKSRPSPRYSSSHAPPHHSAQQQQPPPPPPPSPPTQHAPRPSLAHSVTSTYLPIFSPAFWASLIPAPLRSSSSPSNSSGKRRAWNPATFYIWMAILIGSASLNHVAERRAFAEFSRRADARVADLREALERVRRGEGARVGVDGRGGRVLGAGVEEVEREWADVLRELQNISKPAKREQGNGDANKMPAAGGARGTDAMRKPARHAQNDEPAAEDVAKATRGEFY